MPKKPELDGDAIAAALARDLPGWSRARKRTVADHAAEAAVCEAIKETGPSLKQLRKKFLGADADAADDAGQDDYGQLDRNRVTIQAEPEDGGPAKTVDIEKGKAKIVQG